MKRDNPKNAQSKCTSGTEKTTTASEDFFNFSGKYVDLEVVELKSKRAAVPSQPT